jgi:transcriptional regulator with XRE-family HTH domain/tetratricopeptide (TPR) repeat protein
VLGTLVRAHRQRLGITQEELAERAGLSIRGLRKIESGRVAAPRPATVRLLAEVFGLTGAERDEFCSRAAGPVVAVPAQLPLDAAGFVGREACLAWLSGLLAPGAPRIAVLAGAPGVGKTSLALHWAHRVRADFPDGQLHANLRGFDPHGAMTAAQALGAFLAALRVPGEALPAGLDAQAALFRSLLADRRMLLVLDNAADAAQVRPLLPGAAGCLVLVTSRSQLTGLVSVEGARPITVDLLSAAEARALLAARLGAARLAAEPDAVTEIVDRCARLPLALAITAARAAIRPGLPLGAVAAALRTSLDALADADASADARTVFSWSYRALPAPAARLFRLVSLHPGPDLPVAAAASLLGEPVDTARTLLEELTRAHLIAETVPGRYGCHDLLRAYAGELVDAQEREPARERLLAHYLRGAYEGAVRRNPNRPPIELPALPDGVVVPDLGDPVEWFTGSRGTLLGVTTAALAWGRPDYAWRLAWACSDFLQWAGHWRDWADSQRVAVEATGRLGDPVQQARAYRYLSRAYTMLGEDALADEACEHGLALARELGDLVGQAHAHMNQANHREMRSRLRDALWHAERARALFEEASDPVGAAHTLNMTGWYLSRLGEYPAALSRAEQALTQLQELSDLPGQANTWDTIACTRFYLGQLRPAVTCFHRSVRLFRELGDRYTEAIVLVRLGDAQDALGNAELARQAWQRARAICAELNYPDPDRFLREFHLVGARG